jgi:hypothetical protein
MAMVIPRDVVEYYHIDNSSVFLLKISGTNRNFVLHIIDNIDHCNDIGSQEKMMSANLSSPASKHVQR